MAGSGRSVATVTVLVVQIALLLPVLATGPMVPTVGPHGPAVPAALVAPPPPSAAASGLSSAIASLARGEGPAHGHSLACGPTGPGAAQCRPQVSVNPWGWNNESAQLASGAIGGPGPTAYASLAFDAADGLFVLFGGCASAAGSVCPASNATWTYDRGAWLNRTADYATLPPARTAAAMDYDANYGAVLLFGGCGRICPLADTWTFTLGAGWTNITSAACASMCPTAVFGGELAWDPQDLQSVLFGGCSDPICAGTVNGTWEELGPALGWYNGALPGAPAPRAFEAWAWDPALSTLLLYGGQYSCGFFALCGSTDTWSWNATTGWYNRSTFVSGSPGPRTGAGMSWDAQTQSMVLFDGLDPVSGAVYADTWNFSCTFGFFCDWTNITPASGQPAREFSAVANDNAGFSPWFLGGYDAVGAATQDQWAYGVPPSAPALTFGPSPTEVFYPTWFNATITGGTPGYLVSYYFPQFGGLPATVGPDSQWLVPLPMTLAVVATSVDAAGLLARGTASLLVLPGPTLAIRGPSTADAGVPATYNASVAPGTGLSPFTFGWAFSDGGRLAGPSVRHTFSSPGVAEIELNVTDRAGLTNATFLNVTVVPAPKLLASATPGTTDPGLLVHFTAVGRLGTGPYTYLWEFGDGSSGTGATPTHAFARSGSYRANVTLTDAVGGTASALVNVTVAPALAATAVASPSAPHAGEAVTFGAAATGGVGSYGYTWLFGDGTSGSGAAPTHVYAAAGTYTARVTVTDLEGSSVNASVVVTVAAPAAGPATSSNFFTSLFGLALVALLVAAAVVGLVLATRRRKGPASSTLPPVGADGGVAPPGPADASPASGMPPPGAR
jgi:PKD repeat protein